MCVYTYTLKVLIMWFYQTPSSCGFSTFFSVTQIVVHSSEVPAQIWSHVSPRCRRMNGVFFISSSKWHRTQWFMSRLFIFWPFNLIHVSVAAVTVCTSSTPVCLCPDREWSQWCHVKPRLSLLPAGGAIKTVMVRGWFVLLPYSRGVKHTAQQGLLYNSINVA